MFLVELARWSLPALLAALPFAWGLHPYFARAAAAPEPPAAAAAAPVPRGDWPPIESGVWELTSTRTLPGGKTQRWNDRSRSCADATELFRGYWGLGVVMEAGCRYEAGKTSANEFKIVSECMVRGAGKVRSEAVVVVKDKEGFEMTVDVAEGKRKYRATQSGRRVSGCDGGPPAGGRP